VNKKFDIYGIGNALVDLQVQVTEAELSALGLTKGGMTLVGADQQQQLLQISKRSNVNQACGGSAANSIIAFSQLGGKTAYGCLVGKDQLGEFYMSEMQELGVTIELDARSAEPTGICGIFITPDAERTMATFLGASAAFSKVEVNEKLLAQSSWLYVEGYLFSSPNGQEAVRQAIAIAKENGVKIAVTFSDAFIVDVFRKPLEAAVSQADLIFANMREAQHFVGVEDESELFNKFKAVAPNVVMTMSERGALVHFEQKDYVVEPFPTKAVDDTGAGDMFAGAFLYAIANGYSPDKAGRLSCFLGSRVVSQLGPRLHCNVRELAGKEGLLSA